MKVKDVSELTGFPEILEGRLKTLHPLVHGGILGRRDSSLHLQQLQEHGIETIDLVAVNLYPFPEVIAKEDVTLAEAIENIDIGGPTMVRAAAKIIVMLLLWWSRATTAWSLKNCAGMRIYLFLTATTRAGGFFAYGLLRQYHQ